MSETADNSLMKIDENTARIASALERLVEAFDEIIKLARDEAEIGK